LRHRLAAPLRGDQFRRASGRERDSSPYRDCKRDP
jgi:hypothetical protein